MSNPPSSEPGDSHAVPEVLEKIEKQSSYLRSSLKVILFLLPVWFLVSYGCGILFRDWLDANAPRVGNAPFGFWMAQQGSVISFVLLLVVYAVWMNRLERKYSFGEEK